MGIGDNLGASFEYAKEALVGKWVRWILLIIIGIIPIVNFVYSGYIVRVLRGIKPAPELEDYGELFVDGLLYFIIAIIWMIPAIIVFMLLVGGSAVLAIATDSLAAIAGMGLGMFVTLIVALFCGLFAIIGLVRFARMEKFGEAFAVGAIMEKIKEIGWVNYIIALVILYVVVGVVIFILGLIPIIGWLLMFILVPFFGIFSARYICNLYDSAGTA
jgi:hypothetical protein